MVVGLIMLYLQKSSEDFLLFVIHDNYLLQWFYTDILCILHLKFNILVIFSNIHVPMFWFSQNTKLLQYRENSPYCNAVMFNPAVRRRPRLCRVSYCWLWFIFIFYIYWILVWYLLLLLYFIDLPCTWSVCYV